MAKHIVMCRFCKKTFDTNQLDSTKWVMPQKGWYYHNECYEMYKIRTINIVDGTTKENVELNEWMDATYRYLKFTAKVNVNYVKFERQWNSFLKKGMTSEGIYYTLRYFVSVRHQSIDKSAGGIGIVPYIYEESAEFWKRQKELKQKIAQEVLPQIERTYKQSDKNVINVNSGDYQNPINPLVKSISFKDVMEDNDD